MSLPVVPPGYRIERNERNDGVFNKETVFTVIDVTDEDRVVTKVTVRHSRRDDWRDINPGSQTSRMDASEARARAAALQMAANELDRVQPC